MKIGGPEPYKPAVACGLLVGKTLMRSSTRNYYYYIKKFGPNTRIGFWTRWEIHNLEWWQVILEPSEEDGRKKYPRQAEIREPKLMFPVDKTMAWSLYYDICVNQSSLSLFIPKTLPCFFLSQLKYGDRTKSFTSNNPIKATHFELQIYPQPLFQINHTPQLQLRALTFREITAPSPPRCVWTPPARSTASNSTESSYHLKYLVLESYRSSNSSPVIKTHPFFLVFFCQIQKITKDTNFKLHSHTSIHYQIYRPGVELQNWTSQRQSVNWIPNSMCSSVLSCNSEAHTPADWAKRAGWLRFKTPAFQLAARRGSMRGWVCGVLIEEWGGRYLKLRLQKIYSYHLYLPCCCCCCCCCRHVNFGFVYLIL